MNYPPRAATSSTPEDRFAELFAQVFGVEHTQKLAPEFPVEDIYGGSRYVNFALRTIDECVAFEIDGLTWHVPDAERIGHYEDQLLRQNSLVHQGWRIFRWTDRQIVEDPENVKEQLALFLERVPGLLAFEDFLPKQHGELLELRPHQEEAIEALERLRSEGNTIALVTHAQGAGKTVTAITDARRLGRADAVRRAYARPRASSANQFVRLWPEVSTGLFLDETRETEEHNIVGTVQSLSRWLTRFLPEDFDYLIVDEAHHATAESYQKLLLLSSAIYARSDSHTRPS